MVVAREVSHALERKISTVHLYSDSKNVLHWVKRPSRDLEQMMARISPQIREETNLMTKTVGLKFRIARHHFHKVRRSVFYLENI